MNLTKGKPLNFYFTISWLAQYQREAQKFILIAEEVLQRFPVDRLCFQMCHDNDNHMEVKCDGYHIRSKEYIDKCVFIAPSVFIEIFYLELDEFSDKFEATFRFPL